MAYNPPKTGEAKVFYAHLTDIQDSNSFKISPTIAAGDFKICKDDGAYSNLTNIPTVSPSGSSRIKFNLTAGEFTGSNISIKGVDQTDPKEWADFALEIPTTS